MTLTVTQVLKGLPIGVNISEQKTGTERTKKLELVLFTPPGAQLVTVNGLDAKQILPELR